MIKAGFAGSGFASTFHYESLLQTGNSAIEPVGVFSLTKAHRERFAAGHGLIAYDSVEALLDDVDVLHVCVPPVLHEQLTVAALRRNVHVILEKPFTGYFGPPGDASFDARSFASETMKQEALASASRMLEAEKQSTASIFYAENWLYAPVVQKEVEIIQKTNAQILRIAAEESHSGSHAPSYGIWRQSGGGSLMGKGCHPLTTVLYLKRVEGAARNGAPIRPVGVTSRTHELTRLPSYDDRGFLRTDYKDIEDYGLMHVIFDDGTVADVISSEVVLGGVYNWIEVFANNHRTRCNINPIDALTTYNPKEEQFKDVYVVEKIGTKQGWSNPVPDENWMNGYVQELRYFYGCIANNEVPVAFSEIGYDTVDVIYSSYLSARNGGAQVAVGEARP